MSFLHPSARTHFGLVLMTEIARDPKPISLATIAATGLTTKGHLEDIIRPLREQGLVKAIRGAHGGYTLTRSSSKITVAEIIKVLEGTFTSVSCLSGESCPVEIDCGSKDIWRRIQDDVMKTMSGITLKDLL